jgi:hypothetical protein
VFEPSFIPCPEKQTAKATKTNGSIPEKPILNP